MQQVVAVVVTFNRIDLVRPLVEQLADTPGVAEVLVVNNASTDGTGAWLDEVSGDRIQGLTLANNTGGAGGFHCGIEWAIQRGAELIWLMDDDGRPAAGCLNLLLARPDLDFWGPVVVDQDKPSELVFPIRLPGSTQVAHTVAAVEAAADNGLLRDIVIPFNGVLITRALVERIGLPRAEFFIWGDDHEFRLRAEKAGMRIGTVATARFHHPSVGDLGTPMMFGRTTYNHSPSDLKHYCMARNNLLNLLEYRGPVHAGAFVVKTVWFYTFTRPSGARLMLSLRGWIAALRKDFSGHRRFL